MYWSQVLDPLLHTEASSVVNYPSFRLYTLKTWFLGPHRYTLHLSQLCNSCHQNQHQTWVHPNYHQLSTCNNYLVCWSITCLCPTLACKYLKVGSHLDSARVPQLMQHLWWFNQESIFEVITRHFQLHHLPLKPVSCMFDRNNLNDFL